MIEGFHMHTGHEKARQTHLFDNYNNNNNKMIKFNLKLKHAQVRSACKQQTHMS